MLQGSSLFLHLVALPSPGSVYLFIWFAISIPQEGGKLCHRFLALLAENRWEHWPVDRQAFLPESPGPVGLWCFQESMFL